MKFLSILKPIGYICQKNMNKIFIIILFVFITFSKSFANKLDFNGLDKLTIDDLNRITSVDLFMDSFTLVEVDQIVKDLYASDLIENVSFAEFSDNFVITIKEYSIIENIYINGNIYIKDETINSFLSSKNNQIFNKSKAIIDLKNIRKLYETQGFKNAQIIFYTEKFSTDRVNLIIDIKENYQSQIKNIEFKGNKTFSDKLLYSKILSKDLSFYNIFTKGSNFDLSQFDFDKNKIVTFYRDKGFTNVIVNYEISKTLINSYKLVFFIKENNRKKVNKVNYLIDDSFKKIISKPIEKFEKELKKNQNYYDFKSIDDFLIQINQTLMSNNIHDFFIDVDVINEKDNFMLNFIKKNINPKKINKININGNVITKDKVIRSKIDFEPGDNYNEYLVASSQKRLKRLPYINQVSISPTDLNTSEDIVDFDIDIDENKKTGNFLFGGSFSGDVGFGLGLSIKDYNFLGTGNEIISTIDLNSERAFFKIEYSDYPSFNPRLKNTYSIYNLTNDFQSSYGYNQDQQGLGFKTNFELNENVSLSNGIRFNSSRGYNAINNSTHISDNIGNFDDFIFDFKILFDSTNDIFYPTKGHKNSLVLNISPESISDDSYFKLRLANEYYYTLPSSNNFIFLNNNLGIADTLNSTKLKTINTFSLGGLNFKGFNYRGIGPKENNYYLGGNKFFTSTVGYGSSFIFDEKDNVNIKLFTTIGSLWDSDYTNNNEFDLRASSGLSFDLLTAVGPISLTYAVPINKTDNDSRKRFNFSIGTSF